MKPRRIKILHLLLLNNFLITALALAGIVLYDQGAMRQLYIDQLRDDLLIRTQFTQEWIVERIQTEPIEDICSWAGALSSSRITLVAADGTVRCDSNADAQQIDNHANRPEFEQAINSGYGEAIRYSQTLQQNMMYLATSFRLSDQSLSVLRLSVPIANIDGALTNLRRTFIPSAVIIFFVVSVISFLLSRRIVAPIAVLQESADRIARGQYGVRPSSAILEIDQTTDAIAQMVAQLQVRADESERQRNELASVLDAMREGVISLDGDLRVVNYNPAAGAMVGMEPSSIERSLVEAVRKPVLHEIAETVSRTHAPYSKETTSDYNGVVRHLRIEGAPIATSQDLLGVVLVLTDMTELRNLERLRRDFVANVSHELRTPLTAIKGAAETILDSAEDKFVQKFSAVIARQSNRLEALVNDLLLLAKFERAEEAEAVAMTEIAIEDIVSNAIESCLSVAKAKGVAICVNDVSLKGEGNQMMLEQAVTNLIANAVAYSPDNSEINIEVLSFTQGDSPWAQISVSDNGPGIDFQHQERLFERFYRVDSSRSRELGGTGLGLSIVKHAVASHGGTVHVDSEPGQGSTFTLRFPLRGSGA